MKKAPAIVLFIVVINAVLLTLPPDVGAKRSGGSRGGSRSRSRSKSKSNQFRGKSELPSRTWTYSPSQVRSINGGRRVVRYRDIRPTGSAPLRVLMPSPITYRPRLSFIALFPLYHHRNYYYYAHNRRVRYQKSESTTAKTKYIIFANLEKHCRNTPVYGINGDEEYLISAIVTAGDGVNTTENSQQRVEGDHTMAPNFTADCLFLLTAPDSSLLRINFNATNCANWPKNCQIVVTGSNKDHNLLFLTRDRITDSSSCSSEVFSTSNKILFRISDCSDINSSTTFAYSLSADVAVELKEESGKSLKWKILIVLGISLSVVLAAVAIRHFIMTINRYRRQQQMQSGVNATSYI